MKEKVSRKKVILDLIENQDVLTQDEMTLLLRAKGFDVTQATVSRDIRDLQLYKVKSSGGKMKYQAPRQQETPPEPAEIDNSPNGRLHRILKDSVVSVASSGNIVIIKTLSAAAAGACEAIDNMAWPEVIGTLAGENTIFMVINSEENVAAVVSRVQELVK